ncbi:Rap1a/Tai family immunity protein [Erythrobacter sp.]|uniref:Rap1a/Tai family immunity protein n=1 Tax=Erythrobacter sp. TaxID=1042 RepID=UPI0025E01B20|nr:Rap1a/Tai family immunity protein [Erythrobacter sp.]
MRFGHRGAALIGLALAAAVPVIPLAAQSSRGTLASDPVEGFESAGELLRKCRESSSFGRSYCFAYLAATADAARSYREWLGGGDPCLPRDLTLGQLADVFEAHLVANPSLTTAQAASVVVSALQETFPCPVTPIAPPGGAPG